MLTVATLKLIPIYECSMAAALDVGARDQASLVGQISPFTGERTGRSARHRRKKKVSSSGTPLLRADHTRNLAERLKQSMASKSRFTATANRMNDRGGTYART